MIFTRISRERKKKKEKKKRKKKKRKISDGSWRVDGYDDRNELQPGLDGKELLYSGKCIDWN